MGEEPEFNSQAAHRYFSARCFNQAWDLIGKKDRTAQEDEEMLRLSFASLWHWSQRDDYWAEKASIGYWQVARIYALLGQADNARRYGQLSLEAGQEDGVGPFYRGYAYEALARAEAVAGNRAKMEEYLDLARNAAEEVSEAEDRDLLLADLAAIG
jgi:hypothetical protein